MVRVATQVSRLHGKAWGKKQGAEIRTCVAPSALCGCQSTSCRPVLTLPVTTPGLKPLYLEYSSKIHAITWGYIQGGESVMGSVTRAANSCTCHLCTQHMSWGAFRQAQRHSRDMLATADACLPILAPSLARDIDS